MLSSVTEDQRKGQDGVAIEAEQIKDEGVMRLPTLDKFDGTYPWGRPKDHFYELNVGLHEETRNSGAKTNDEGMKIMAFGFVGEDKYNDLISVNEA